MLSLNYNKLINFNKYNLIIFNLLIYKVLIINNYYKNIKIYYVFIYFSKLFILLF